jgi:maltooligosyltrehalose trehalohydrolase
MNQAARRYAQGPEVIEGGVDFRVWAPEHRQVEVVLEGWNAPIALAEESEGYWSVFVENARVGERYRYRLDGQPPDLPDPAGRFFPEGPHGSAQIVDGRSFSWTDGAWRGLDRSRHVIYELHGGTFSPEGSWAGMAAKLPWLSALGVTTLELMPVAEFDGRFGWGYDGVAWFAPSHLYGTPDDLRRLVDRAHALGLAVILDVVYNHFGASGDYSGKYSRFYFGQVKTEWGMGLNYDGEHCEGMRALTIDNAAYWIREYHLDGLRLDATQAIIDASPEHVITALVRAARAAAPERHLLLVAENEPQDTRLLREHAVAGVGSRLDALWNDDLHHSVRVALTGRRQAYFRSYAGTAREWCASLLGGLLYQGQRYDWQDKSRGQSTRGLPMRSFIGFLENHDQVANSLWAMRLWQESQPAQYRALTTLLLLGPWTPMLFQGQEWESSAPFHYFASHEGELARLVQRGRAEFLAQFPGCAHRPELLLDPADPQAFERSRLRWDERDQDAHAAAVRLHRDLLALRHNDPTLGVTAPPTVQVLAVPLTESCALVRWVADAGEDPEDRILLLNLGADFSLAQVIDPLLAPAGRDRRPHWRTVWTSENPSYGGHDCDEPERAGGRWVIPGAAAVLLAPSAR